MGKGICDGLVAIVTGAGRGIGRAESLELARQGACVVVNDVGAAPDGSGASAGPANDVVDEIRAMGGQAIANDDDVSDFDAAERLIQSAIKAFGNLHVLVNNAGILRDRTLVNMTPREWDDVIRVHLRGTYAPTHHAANYWRTKGKEGPLAASVINTASASGLYGRIGQSNYGAAKAGIASFSIITAQELARFGVRVNVIAPGAITRLTEFMVPESDRPKEGEHNPLAPDNIARLVTWLASDEASGVTGRVFNVAGGHISVADGWVVGAEINTERSWECATLGEHMRDLLSRARPSAGDDGRLPTAG